MACSTRWSVMPRSRSCSSTMRRVRSRGSPGVLRKRPKGPIGPMGRGYNRRSHLASPIAANVPASWRRPIKQRSRLLRRSGPPHLRVGFAHPSEQEFARFLDYYRIRWVYEPVAFPIAWEEGRVTEMFAPDFYLPEHDLY